MFQGVNLLNIIRDPQLYSGGGNGEQKHVVLEAIDTLTANLAAASLDDEAVKSNLMILKTECDKDLARRYVVIFSILLFHFVRGKGGK